MSALKLNPRLKEFPSRETYKLDAIRRVAKRIGHPEKGRRTILVAGTNGKGSVCAYLTSLFMEAGLKVGTYSSPHIVHPEERIRIDGKEVSAALIEKYERSYQNELSSLTYFERWTMLAFLIFRDQKVDLQVLEVGIGGRLDATNISDPDFSVITQLDYDHQDVLGDTLTQIAQEKAGVMRRDRSTFTLRQSHEAKKEIERAAQEKGAHLTIVGQTSKPLKNIFSKVQRRGGRAQFQNAQLAWACFEKASEDWQLPKLKIAQIQRSFSEKVLWRARFEIFRKRPLLIVDGAHNPNAARSLVTQLKSRFPQKKFHLIFGAMEDKDATSVLKTLKPVVRSVEFPIFYPERQRMPSVLETIAKKLRIPLETRTVAKAREPILVAGSFYLAGALLKEWEDLGHRSEDTRR